MIALYSRRMMYETAHWLIKAIRDNRQTQFLMEERAVASESSMVLFHVGDYSSNLKMITTTDSIFGNGSLRFANTSVLAFLCKQDGLSEHYMRLCLQQDPNFTRAFYIKAFYLYRTGRIN